MDTVFPIHSCGIARQCLSANIFSIPLWTKRLNKMDDAGLLTLFPRTPLGGTRTGSTNSPAGKGFRGNIPSQVRPLQCIQQSLTAGPTVADTDTPPTPTPYPHPLSPSPTFCLLQQTEGLVFQVSQQLLVAGNALQQVASLRLQLRPLLNTYITQSLMYLYSVTGDALQQVASLGLQLQPFLNTHITWSLSMFLHNVAGNARHISASPAGAVPENTHNMVLVNVSAQCH